MTKRTHFCLLLLLCTCVLAQPLAAQTDDEVLFTVADEPVTVGEFRYIYGKTNGETADYSEASVREYLDLYERFKLKVARARDMGLDTVSALRNELAGYRRQLADNYLIDRQVTDKLTEQLHQRMQTDIEIHHILFQLAANPNPSDTLRAYQQALEAKKTLTTANFAEVATRLSQDKYTKDKGGRIGFVTAPFPNGLHRLEDALYPAGEKVIVGPVRTGAGYHLAMKTATRPARGEVEVAHVFVRKPKEEQVAKGTADGAQVQALIKKAQSDLASGMSFEQVVGLHSMDDKTKNNGGYIGFFGINRYEPAFEEAAFALENDGDVSDIVETRTGYHILRRISRKPVAPLTDARPLLEKKIKADGRYAAAEAAMLANLRKQYYVNQNERAFGIYAASLVDSTFFDYRWTPSYAPGEGEQLMTIGNEVRTVGDLEAYFKSQARKRLSLTRQHNAYGAAEELFREWADQQVIAYAEARLEDEFPEFRALMREYREGILLFEATKIEVWDKASADSAGLQTFFNVNRDKYQFAPRAVATRYEIDNKGGLDINAITQFAAANGMDATLDEFGRQYINTTTDAYEIDRLPELGEGLKMVVGSQSAVQNDLRTGKSVFYKVEALEPARAKELKEARGYVIADYQDKLEREWVEQLRRTYPVKMNKKVLNKLVE